MSGGVSIDMTNNAAHVTFHLMQLRGAIRMEAMGMRHSSGRSALKFAKDLYGFKGNRDAVLAQIETRLAELKAEAAPAFTEV